MTSSRICVTIGAAALAVGGLSGAAFAQDYNAAKAQGLLGEKMDGYVAVIGGGSAELRKLADDTNIKRKAVYAEKAKAERATVEEYAFTSGCLLISQTRPGMKYEAPGGGWETRGAGAAKRDPRCP
ncbi:MAG TPA: YdbL family protein [Novosphingobium sp.]|nr:YdbL family protein [Novosphingobium sp.]